MMLPSDLRLAYEACRQVSATTQSEICFRWIDANFKRLGVTPQKLRRLAAFGALTRTDQTRRGVYYRLSPDR